METTKIIPPIIVVEEGYVTLYRSVEDAEQAVEAIDVQEGLYDPIYDSTGRKLMFKITEEKTLSKKLFGPITIVSSAPIRIIITEPEDVRTEELRLRLVESLLSDFPGKFQYNEITDYELSKLITLCIDVYGYVR